MSYTTEGQYKRTVAPKIEPISISEAKDHLRIDGTDNDSYIYGLILAAREWVEGYLGRSLIEQTWQLTIDGSFPPEFKLRYPPLISVTSLQYVDTDQVTQTYSSDNYDVDTSSEPGRITLDYDESSWPTVLSNVNDVTVTYKAGYQNDNQPDNDGLEIISDSSSDTMQATITGTDNTTGEIVVETKTLNGTTAVSTSKTDWGEIQSVVLASTASGVITVREASANATVGIIVPGTTTVNTTGIPASILHAMKLLIGHFYENREETIVGTVISKVPMAVEALLNNYRFINVL